jgi:hypothetical protein
MPRPQRKKTMVGKADVPTGRASTAARSTMTTKQNARESTTGSQTQETRPRQKGDAQKTTVDAPGPFMTGALPLGKVPDSPRRVSTRGRLAKRRSEVEDIDTSSEVVTAQNDIVQSTSTAKPSSREASLENTANTIDEPQERPVLQSARAGTPQRKAQSDSDSLYAMSPEGEKSRLRVQANVDAKATSPVRMPKLLKTVGTPAVGSSMLGLSRFKRRARQPSIIRLVQQTSELGDPDDFSLGDFSPEDESTPLNAPKGRASRRSLRTSTGMDSSELRTSSSRKRKIAEVDSSNVLVTRSPVPGSSPPPLRHSGSDISAANVPIPDSDGDAGPMSDTMAPPKSSSPMAPSPKVRRTSKQARPSTPNQGRTRSRKQRDPDGPSTELLRSLLPRRRMKLRDRRFDVLDMPSSSPTRSDDSLESSWMKETPIRKPLRNLRNAQNMDKTSTPKSVSKAKSKPTPKSVARPTATATSATKPVQASKRRGGRRRTYGGTSNDSDKENDSFHPGADENEAAEIEKSTEQLDLPAKVEMQKMKKKFDEVDDWEMEFETVDMGGTSSPWR